MSTIIQLVFKKLKKKKAHKHSPRLLKCPQGKGVVRRPRIVTPRKPNSARRPVAKVYLNNNKRLTAHLPGVGHNIRPHSSVLVEGIGPRDLPGVKYTCIRGVFDFAGLNEKTKRRSIYGVKLNPEKKKKIRRRYRII